MRGLLTQRETRWLVAIAYSGFAITVFVFREDVVGWILIAPIAVYGIYEFGRDIGRMFGGVVRFMGRVFGPGL